MNSMLADSMICCGALECTPWSMQLASCLAQHLQASVPKIIDLQEDPWEGTDYHTFTLYADDTHSTASATQEEGTHCCSVTVQRHKIWEEEGSKRPLAVPPEEPELLHHQKSHSQWVTLIRQHAEYTVDHTLIKDMLEKHCLRSSERWAACQVPSLLKILSQVELFVLPRCLDPAPCKTCLLTCMTGLTCTFLCVDLSTGTVQALY